MFASFPNLHSGGLIEWILVSDFDLPQLPFRRASWPHLGTALELVEPWSLTERAMAKVGTSTANIWKQN